MSMKLQYYIKLAGLSLLVLALTFPNVANAQHRQDVISKELDIIERLINTPVVQDQAIILEPELRRTYRPISQQATQRVAQSPSKNTFSDNKEPAPQFSYDKSKELDTSKYRSDQTLPQEAENETPGKIEKFLKGHPNVDISGEVRLGAGVTSDEKFFTRANADLNELNYRILSNAALNNKENTFDPAVFSRLRFNVDAKTDEEKIAFHTNLTIDPWSFTGKSRKVIISGGAAPEGTGVIDNPDVDSAEIQLLWWGNTGYTLNQTYRTLEQGDGIALPELKVVDGKTRPLRVNSTFGSSEDHFDKWFDIPALKIEKTFQPIRELWLDVKPAEYVNLRVFPMAYHDQALTSDDPLNLSNNKSYWEPSPWINSWTPGHYNSDEAAEDFFQGFWDNRLAFVSKDSDYQYLTALRGASLSFFPGEDTSIEATVATPKTLWQEYSEVSSVPGSIRGQHFFGDNAYIGGIGNMFLGFVDDEDLDAANYVYGIDGGYQWSDRTKVKAQINRSHSRYDITNSTYETEQRGWAYHLELSGASVPDDLILKKDYFNLISIDQKKDYYKYLFYATQMDDGFESRLSNYRQTRDDTYWARHLSFRPPDDLWFTEGLGRAGVADLKPFAFGDGIDYGRYVFGFRLEKSFLDTNLIYESDFRNVHRTDNDKDDYIETVTRNQLTFTPTERLTTKFLFLYHDRPKTDEGIDPYVTDANGRQLVNDFVRGGENPDLKNTAFGLEYKLTETLAWHGAWEYTNDLVTLGADNFPRAVLNSSSFETFMLAGNTYRRDIPFLYSQFYFDLPPYEFHNIFKTGLTFQPSNKLNIYLDYTRNPNTFAGPIDQHMNHIGLSVGYKLTKKLGILSKYTYSQAYDINRLVHDSVLDEQNYHNFYAELRYKPQHLENFVLQYGVGAVPNISTASYNPFGGYLPVLDTQHLVRVSYLKYF